MSKRRTQQERRTETIGKLVDATTECLAEHGYAHATTARICERAGLSQGAMFNHFSSRLDLIVCATEQISASHVAAFADLAAPRDSDTGDVILALVEFARATTRSPRHAAWHEIMVAARTNRELRQRVAVPLERFEQALLETARRVLAVSGSKAERVGMVLLSCMHMFDSEAVTAVVYPNPAIEAARTRWVAGILHAELRD